MQNNKLGKMISPFHLSVVNLMTPLLPSAERLKSVSEGLGLTMAVLSPATKSHVHNLAATSLALGLGDCSDSRYGLSEAPPRARCHVAVFCFSLCVSLSELVLQRAKDEVARGELERERELLQQDLRVSLVKQANQKRSVLHQGGQSWRKPTMFGSCHPFG